MVLQSLLLVPEPSVFLSSGDTCFKQELKLSLSHDSRSHSSKKNIKSLEIHNKIGRVPNPGLHPDCALKINVQLPCKEQDLSLRASQLSSGGFHGQISFQRALVTLPLHPRTWLQLHPSRSTGFGDCFQVSAGYIAHTQPVV